jgi:uncharacterized damage-inducible protein DinB
MDKTYRPGAKGALLDIYEQAIAELKELIRGIPATALLTIADPNTRDENCRSIQTILSHVVHAGYGYATSIRNLKGANIERPAKTFHDRIPAYLADLDAVFAYTEETFKSVEELDLEPDVNAPTIKSTWGQVYDIEQITEHAIVHILRHKRQIEKFMKVLI